MVKNFDMVFIYRDFANFKRISSIPMEQLDTIKEWLNDSDVFYTEGPISLQWTNILQQIRSDIGDFIESGGWTFLKENDGQDDEQDSVAGTDSNFDEGEEMKQLESERDDSDDSGGSDYENDDDNESSSVKTQSEDDGEDWDEMERKTIARE